jgi:hypothetical protein
VFCFSADPYAGMVGDETRRRQAAASSSWGWQPAGLGVFRVGGDEGKGLQRGSRCLGWARGWVGCDPGCPQLRRYGRCVGAAEFGA